MPHVRIVPAVLGRTRHEAQRSINRLRILHAPIHLDLTDGRFVSTRSFGPPSLARLKFPPNSSAHLMVANPASWIQACAKVGIRTLILHLESKITQKFLQKLRGQFQITLAMKPGTSPAALSPYRRYASAIQVMTVRPGKQGRPFLTNQLKVVRSLRRRFPRLKISVDGAMNERTIPAAITAGATEIVVGSAFKRSPYPGRTYRQLRSFVGRVAKQYAVPHNAGR
ncbi:MAG: hypothetical protein HY420_03965 [Candidatus Kerfeldbacteria bacterium]|nr:hypothetical protein [Candidatus Kerfeldbacteria bacterium]